MASGSPSIAAMAEPPRPSAARQVEHAARDERLARALRDNLRRRKEQTRARQRHAGERPDKAAGDEPAS